MEKKILCCNSLRNHGVCIHILHCKTLHGFFVSISGSCNQIASVFHNLLFHFYCFFIFHCRKKPVLLLQVQIGKSPAVHPDSLFAFFPADILQHSEDKNQSNSYSQVITGSCNDSLSRCLSTVTCSWVVIPVPLKNGK